MIKAVAGKARVSFLGTFELQRLDHLAVLIHTAFGAYPYLVGSANDKADYRDVDIRLMLPDATFDALFKERRAFWALVCYSISAWLRADTGLPIDFQIQRTTEANKKYGGQFRNPLGGRGLNFAGYGDATNRWPRDKEQRAAYLKRKKVKR